MRFVLAEKSARDASTSERLINLYAVPAPLGGMAPFVLRNVPGTTEFATIQGPFLRGMERVNDTLYAVSAGGLHRIGLNGAVSRIADIADDVNTSISGHRDGVTVAAGGNYYLYDGGVTLPGSGRISNVGSVAFLDQFTLLGEDLGREIEWTEAGLPDDRNALYFRTAEATDDPIIRILEHDAYLAVFKRRSFEIWSGTRLGGSSAFASIPSSVRKRGLKSFGLVTRTPGGLFFIGDDNVAYMLQGSVETPVSTVAVDVALQSETPTSCFYYEDRGHRFAVIRFENRPAWVFDLSMGMWHERASGAEHGAWDVVGSAFCYGQWHLATRLGRILRLTTAPTDLGGVMRRTAVSRIIYGEGDRFNVRKLEILGRFGNGDTSLWARVSKDGGVTWGPPKIRPLANTGEFGTLCTFRAMGQFRKFSMELNITDPVDVPLLSEGLIE